MYASRLASRRSYRCFLFKKLLYFNPLKINGVYTLILSSLSRYIDFSRIVDTS